eukprot:156050-Rhodomonas_salina.2
MYAMRDLWVGPQTQGPGVRGCRMKRSDTHGLRKRVFVYERERACARQREKVRSSVSEQCS